MDESLGTDKCTLQLLRTKKVNLLRLLKTSILRYMAQEYINEADCDSGCIARNLIDISIGFTSHYPP